MKENKPRQLNNHKAIVNYKCKYCDQVFKSSANKTMHQKSHKQRRRNITRK